MPKKLQDVFKELPELPTEEVADLALMWQITDKADFSPRFNDATQEARMWEAIAQKTIVPSETSKRLAQVRPMVRNSWMYGIVASLVFLVASVVLYKMVQPEIPQERVFLAKAGEIRTEKLPDGSQVKLNSGSEIRFLQTDAHRKVLLKGEAFFEVSHNGKPFSVQTFNAIVRVMGTRFNVRTIGQKTEVVLETGKVALAGSQEGQALLLLPGQWAEVYDGKVEDPQNIEVKTELSWLNGGFAMTNVAVQDLAAHLVRLYDRPIFVENKRLGAIAITLHYAQRPALEALLTDVCASASCQVVPQKNGFVLR
ncbi:MAG: FecR domain-containing protein [Bacteroidetes Order II. Incertae sedis bacterium]|nr:FecR domain-containing protein [Bacteroidetes Order II. bacterium]